MSLIYGPNQTGIRPFAADASYKRNVRRVNELARLKEVARSKANNALRTGIIFKHPCSCGSNESEMHHPDYSKPLDVVWYCDTCHTAFHVLENDALNLA